MEITAKQLQEKINKGEKIIVEFYGHWCNPCMIMKPKFEKIASENTTEVEMFTMDVDLNRDIALSLGVRSIPVIKIFNGGEMVESVVGVLEEDQIKGLIKSLVNG